MFRRLTNRAISQRRRRLFTYASSHLEDEGDWFYSSEWWASDVGEGASNSDVVFREVSGKGNGVVTVTAYPSSVPGVNQWSAVERQLQQKYQNIYAGSTCLDRQFKVLGYQWRVLRFNDDTRQSTVKIMAIHSQSDRDVKSMVSAGLSAIASTSFDFESAVLGNKTLHILCIGHGGGTLPLFLASKIQGAMVDVIEIDPVVIKASKQAMGFPTCSTKGEYKSSEDSSNGSTTIKQILWGSIPERLSLYIADAEDFTSGSIAEAPQTMYDLVFIDAYDGEDVFPHKLWDAEGPFLKSLKTLVHPDHGTVVVNLHAEIDSLTNSGSPLFHPLLPMGKHVCKVCRAYRGVLLDDSVADPSGLAFTVASPWVCNMSLVVSRGRKVGRLARNGTLAFNSLMSSSLMVERLLELPFPCIEYLKKGFVIVDDSL